ncbi:hypothetical protein EV694_2072 [Volucribacter psittacicida]|uniref:(Na+)-NQR maturation NqrM n=1 Tax=Volucribacter psittacicida TaxID=203482 RepID=A0A4R1FR72_9PAST|nr:(Na+)-NQR maturation NqrM [Volucribacter psittacicida]TCJ94838.1 hypothetical protein EV694_2072 [Volucribacter psittacicida]
MKTFLITLVIFLLIILAMALGYIFNRKELKGSCGGMSAMGIEKMCDCEEPCDNLKDKVEKGEVDPSELARFNNKQEAFYEVK